MIFLDFATIIASLGGIVGLILIVVVLILVYLFSLKIGIQAVKGTNTGLGSVFLTALINVLVSFACFAVGFFIPAILLIGWLIAIIISLLVIKSRHDTSFLGALGAVIIAIIIVLIIFFIIALIMGATILTILMAIFSP
ncbi:MAG: hypothetical protein ACTSWY_01150 [Promethearchaeota archaeon]